MSFEPTTSSSTLVLQGENLLSELELIGKMNDRTHQGHTKDSPPSQIVGPVFHFGMSLNLSCFQIQKPLTY